MNGVFLASYQDRNYMLGKTCLVQGLVVVVVVTVVCCTCCWPCIMIGVRLSCMVGVVRG